MANIFAENQNLFATTRQIILPTDDLKSEDAWNYGVSFLQNFNFNLHIMFGIFKKHYLKKLLILKLKIVVNRLV